METFRAAMPFVDHPAYTSAREEALSGLQDEIAKGLVDPPVLPLLADFVKIPHCFTLQCCYGHFVHEKQPSDHNLARLAPYAGTVRSVRYRIAYLALCIEDTEPGHELFHDLGEVPAIDPGSVQFGSAGWFWEHTKNSYAVQVEPARFMGEDSAELGMDEALHVEQVRDRFFDRLGRIAKKHRSIS